MKLPSIPYLAEAFATVLRRFPFVMLSAAAGAFAAMMLIEQVPENYDTEIAKVMITAALGLSAFLCAALAAEKWRLAGLKKWLPSLVAAILLAIYYLTLDIGKNNPGVATMLQFAGFLLTAHLLVSYLPYLDETPVADFWEYNKQLFGNFVTGAFYSLVLYAGLAIAILAVDNLFNLHIDGKIYAHLFVVIAAIFNTAFFLANFPGRFTFGAQPDADGETAISSPYTTGIKNLTKFILIPIVAIYFLILYAYSTKILLTWQLPHGWVGSLVMGFSVAGIFTYLLNYLLVKYDTSALVGNYRKWFFFVLLPMVVLLFVAIGRRISDYGVTENRYVVATAGVWLFLTSVYFIISKKDNIKFIPVSLSIFALLTVLGPFSAFNVSERSQTNRLETLLSQNNMLVDGKAVPAKDSLPGADAESIRSTLHYLREYEHFRTAAGWFGLPDDKTPDWSELDKLINDLNIGYAMASARDCFASFPDYNGIDLDDYEKMYIVYTNDGESPGDSLTGFSLTKDRKALLLWENGQATDQFDLQPYLQKIAGKYDCGKDQFNKEDALFNTGGSIWDAKLVTQNMSFEKGENYSVKQWNGIILLRRKQ